MHKRRSETHTLDTCRREHDVLIAWEVEHSTIEGQCLVNTKRTGLRTASIARIKRRMARRSTGPVR